jgi:hypothetical protein
MSAAEILDIGEDRNGRSTLGCPRCEIESDLEGEKAASGKRRSSPSAKPIEEPSRNIAIFDEVPL